MPRILGVIIVSTIILCQCRVRGTTARRLGRRRVSWARRFDLVASSDASARPSLPSGSVYRLRRCARSSGAISLFEPELPLEPGRIAPRHGVVASCLRDASPDTWGRRVIVSRWPDPTVDDLGELTYMLESGSDRIGGLDFQASPTDYVPRDRGQAARSRSVR